MSKFKAIIVGGSIAGQTLALALDAANIDYVLLEAQPQFAPQLGASIGLWPNGLRILDQLGIYEEIAAIAEPLVAGYYRRPDGTAFAESELFTNVAKRYCFLTKYLILLSFIYNILICDSRQTCLRLNFLSASAPFADYVQGPAPSGKAAS